MSYRLFFYILPFLCILNSGTLAFAETTDDQITQEAVGGTPLAVLGEYPTKGSALDQCVWTCRHYDPHDRKTQFRKNCEATLHDRASGVTFLGFIALTPRDSSALGMCVVDSGIKAVMGYYNLAVALFDNQDEAQATARAERCYNDPTCKPGLMRLLMSYREMNTDGTYKVPEAKMIHEVEKVHKLDFGMLWTHARIQFMETRNECVQYAFGLKMQITGGNNYGTVAQNRKVYDQIVRERTYCISALQMLPPEIDQRLQSAPPVEEEITTPQVETLLSKLGITEQARIFRTCFPDDYDQWRTNVCSDIGSILVNPVPISKIRLLAALAKGSKGNKIVVAERTVVAYADDLFRPTGILARSNLVSEFKSLVFATPKQNSDFFAVAIKANAGLLNPARTRFAVFENTAIKFLNSKVPKEFVTALTNFHKQHLKTNIDALILKYQQKYPGIKINFYSDFKSIQISIESATDISKAMHDEIFAGLNGAFTSANEALLAKMIEVGIDVSKVGPPNMWFRGAIGAIPDETNIAARMARAQTTGNHLADFTNPAVRAQAEKALGDIEMKRLALSQNTHLNQSMLSFVDANGNWLPRAEIFDLARKYSPEELMVIINQRYAKVRGFKPLNANDARKLKAYVVDVNEFNPNVYIPERVVLSMDPAEQGAASIDFVGLGAENYLGTAAGLAGHVRISTALAAIRRNEVAITKEFKIRQAAFASVINRYAPGGVKCSGDDCIKIFTEAMGPAQKGRLMDAIARNGKARRVRVAFVGPGVASEHRMMLATHGEEIEKKLREALEGRIPYSRLSRITFGLDMTTTQLSQGWVNLMIGKPRAFRLTLEEQRIIQEAYGEAIAKYNATHANYLAGDVSARVTGLYLVPGPALIMNGTSNEGEE